MNIGDFVLVERKGVAAWLIRFGQGWRFHGKNRKYARWTHAALIVSPKGDLVEALTRGVVRSHIDKYKGVPCTLVRVNASPEDQLEILRFANKVVGEEYGWATIACIVVGHLTSFTFGFQGQAICSGLIARAEERMGAYFDRLAEDIDPADLARYYNV